MKPIFPLILAALAAGAASDYPVKPVPFTAVHVTDQFWAPKIETRRAEWLLSVTLLSI